MTKAKGFTAILVVALIGAGGAVAQSATETDGDGMVSFAELRTAVPDATEETFLAADSNADGVLDEDENMAGQEAGVLPS